MPDAAVVVRRPALADLALGKSAAFTVRDAGLVARFAYRGNPAPAAAVFGVALPGTPCTAATAGGRAALWLGPDEWLLLAPHAESEPLRAALTTAVADGTAVVVDVSQRNFGLELSGPKATDALATGCPLDLDVGVFPAGACTRTLLGKAEVVLWRTGPETFRLEAWRSFAPYVVAFLAEAAYGLA